MTLKQYSAMAAAFLAMKQKSDAQIIYTDIPDTVIYPGTYLHPNNYALDLNNDGQVDFNFIFWKADFMTGGYHIQFFTLNEYVSSNQNQIEGDMHDALALHVNDNINVNKPWIAASSIYLGYFASSINVNAGTTHFISSGNWISEQDNYLGLRLIQGGDTLYGWVRMDVEVRDSVVFKDYAYNASFGESIYAGEGGIPTTASNPASDPFDFAVFPNPSSKFIFIKNSQALQFPVSATILDVSGKKLLSQEISSAKNPLDISSLPDGFYLLRLNNNDRCSVRKFEVLH